MKYKKGDFVLVPNKELLRGKPTELTALYFWLASYSDKDGLCYPSRKKLAKDCGMTDRTVDKYMKELVALGLLTKHYRVKEGTKQKKSNLYQLLVVMNDETDDTRDSETENTKGGVSDDSRDSEPNIPGTITTNNYTTLTKDISKDISLPLNRGKNYLQRLTSLYGTLFMDTYGFKNKVNFGQMYKVFKKLHESYSEVQIGWLLCVFFSWSGMDGRSPREREWLTRNSHAIHLFQHSIVNYETYTRNVLKMAKEFDDDSLLLPEIAKYITNLK